MQQFFSLLSWCLFTAQHVSGVFPPIIRSSMTAVAASGFTFVSWWQPARPRTQHDCHHDTKVKPEAATAVIKLLTMGGKTPETCWAVNKRQDNKLENCCIWLVIYLNYLLIILICRDRVTPAFLYPWSAGIGGSNLSQDMLFLYFLEIYLTIKHLTAYWSDPPSKAGVHKFSKNLGATSKF
jgi:hypothetical protein